VSDAGQPAAGSDGAISGDGRFVAFLSYSPLVAGDTATCPAFTSASSCPDVFVRDRVAGTTSLVSVSSSGEQGNGPSGENDFHEPTNIAISPDGRFVAFGSRASNLVEGDTNGVEDVFVRDRLTGGTVRASVSSSGQQANSHSKSPSISADGRYLSFQSFASNLVPADTNGDSDIFVHDVATGATIRASVSSSGSEADGGTLDGSSLSADGRFVAFASFAHNLVPGDRNWSSDIFVRDLITERTTLESRNSWGVQGNLYSRQPSISPDGRWVAFTSNASNLVGEDTNACHVNEPNCADIFVRDRETGSTIRVSVGSLGQQADDRSEWPSISDSGCVVGFETSADNLAPRSGLTGRQILVHERMSRMTTSADVDSAGVPANGSLGSARASISWGGRLVAFTSSATNLDSAGTGGVFVRDRGGDDRAPVLDPVPDLAADVGMPFQFAVSACDLDGHPLTWSALGLPPGAVLNPTTGVLDWTPTADQRGLSWAATVTVSDPQGRAASHDFFVRATSAATARAPFEGEATSEVESADVGGFGTAAASATADKLAGSLSVRTTADQLIYPAGVVTPVGGYGVGTSRASAAARVMHEIEVPGAGTYRVTISFNIDSVSVASFSYLQNYVRRSDVTGAQSYVAAVGIASFRPCGRGQACSSGAAVSVARIVASTEQSASPGPFSIAVDVTTTSLGTLAVTAGLEASSMSQGSGMSDAQAKAMVTSITAV
jgi:Tol biopolymer transport system component